MIISKFSFVKFFENPSGIEYPGYKKNNIVTFLLSHLTCLKCLEEILQTSLTVSASSSLTAGFTFTYIKMNQPHDLHTAIYAVIQGQLSLLI